jgi:hypothetical protein
MSADSAVVVRTALTNPPDGWPPSTSDDPSRALIAEVRSAAEHLVSQLAHRQQVERRSAKQVARCLR